MSDTQNNESAHSSESANKKGYFDVEKEYSVGQQKFVTGGKGRAWANVPDELWNNWIWQQQNRVRTLEKLKEVINITPEEEQAYE
jgi:hypothetical protein